MSMFNSVIQSLSEMTIKENSINVPTTTSNNVMEELLEMVENLPLLNERECKFPVQAVPIINTNNYGYLIELADNSLKVMDLIAKRQIKLNEEKTKFDKTNKKYKRNIILAVIFFIYLLCVISGLLSAIQKKTLSGSEGTVISLVLCGIEALLIIYAVRLSKKKNKLVKENEENNKSIKQEIYELQCDKSLDWLPVNYREPIPFDCIYRYLLDKRANNLQEALNLFETELHQARMEQIAAQNSYR